MKYRLPKYWNICIQNEAKALIDNVICTFVTLFITTRDVNVMAAIWLKENSETYICFEATASRMGKNVKMRQPTLSCDRCEREYHLNAVCAGPNLLSDTDKPVPSPGCYLSCNNFDVERGNSLKMNVG